MVEFQGSGPMFTFTFVCRSQKNEALLLTSSFLVRDLDDFTFFLAVYILNTLYKCFCGFENPSYGCEILKISDFFVQCICKN